MKSLHQIKADVGAVMLNAMSALAVTGAPARGWNYNPDVDYSGSRNRVSQKKRRKYARQQGTTVKAMRG